MRTLGPLADRLAASARRLLDGPVENERLVAESRPWIEAFAVGAAAMQAIARLTAEGRLESDGASVLRPFLGELRARRVRIFGDVLDMTLDDLCHTPSLPHPHPEPLTEELLLTQKEQQ